MREADPAGRPPELRPVLLDRLRPVVVGATPRRLPWLGVSPRGPPCGFADRKEAHMKARPFFYLLALAVVVWMILVLARGTAAPADESPITTDTTADPPADSAEVTALHAQLDEATRKLAYVNRKRVAERRGFRRRLAYVIHSTAFGGSWLERAFLCIHAGEGSWSDPNPPYWGGVQMDMSFQRTYGDWALRAFGTADHWPASVQVATAIRAYTAGRGFYPWPNTARACGLIG
jgi:hypothetical protein